MLSVGVDILEIGRMQNILDRWGARFWNRVYTTRELERARGRVRELAVRFCAKEAVMKALGTGAQVPWKDIEIWNDPQGKPEVRLLGRAKIKAEEVGLMELDISLSHSWEYAVALAVAQRHHPQAD
ncbi:MAG: holo-ACP synthase [Chloroflexi bacterium]|nr:holo-ACP synthase [Chloroflexota bacterium]